MKKIISFAAAALITLGAGGSLAWQSSPGAEACELPYCTQMAAHTHSICSIPSCVQSVNHLHNGNIYYPHHENDGHNHRLSAPATTPVSAQPSGVPVNSFRCDVFGCTETGDHEHAVCSTADCTLESEHSHNNIIYLGHSGNDGQNQSQISEPQSTTLEFSCGVSGCNKTEEHYHTNCTVNGCNQMTNHDHNGIIYYGHSGDDGHAYHNCGVSGCSEAAEHSHFRCDVSGCNRTEEHNHTNCTVTGCNQMINHDHDGEIYYGHSGNDGHAYHNCGVSGCTQSESHVHNSCGVSGCGNTGSHSHESKSHQSNNSSSHKSNKSSHKSGHGGGHH